MRVGGARPPPFTTFTITSKVAMYAQAEWADPVSSLPLYALCGVYPPLFRGEDTLAGWRGGWGSQYFGRRKTQLCTLPISNPLCWESLEPVMMQILGCRVAMVLTCSRSSDYQEKMVIPPDRYRDHQFTDNLA